MDIDKINSLQKELQEINDLYKEAEKKYHQIQSYVISEYDKILDKFQLQNPNIPVFELWKQSTLSQPFLSKITINKYEADEYNVRGSQSTIMKYWVKERRLRNYDIEDLRKIYPFPTL